MADFVEHESDSRHDWGAKATFDAMPNPVWLSKAHDSKHGVLPLNLVGRVISSQGRYSTVRFWNRGVFRVERTMLRAAN